MAGRIISLAVFVSTVGAESYAGVVVSMVGDDDGFVPGDAADVPFRSAALQASLTASGHTPFKDLDEPVANFGLGYTHTFDIPSGHLIATASLEVRIFPGHAGNFFALDRNVDGAHPWSSAFGPRAVFADLTGDPVVGGQFMILTIDLAAVPMRPDETGTAAVMDLLPELSDGVLNVGVAGDTGIDYSRLVIDTVAPVPATSTAQLIAQIFVIVAICCLICSTEPRTRPTPPPPCGGGTLPTPPPTCS